MTRPAERPFYPVQTQDGRTFVMRGEKVQHELSSPDTTVRWRHARDLADRMNKAEVAARERGRSLRMLVYIILATWIIIGTLFVLFTKGS